MHRTTRGRRLPASEHLLPRVDPLGLARRALSMTAIVAAVALCAWHIGRLHAAPISLGWWIVPAVVAGALAADFLSGVVHWAADTWGDTRMPVVGERLLYPFRVHHVNPDDFLGRRFLDANGEVAALTVPALAGALMLPLEQPAGVTGVAFVTALCTVGMWTNQIHQWAHRTRPPPVVRVLQDCRIILPPRAHALHHRAPYATSYCITTGWCNRPLEAMGFFPRLERMITLLTGVRPRRDEIAFHANARCSARRHSPDDHDAA